MTRTCNPFALCVPESMKALPGRFHSADEQTIKKYVQARAERQAKMREYYARNRLNVRSQQQRKRLQARIDACTDPIVRGMLECFRNGESVEAIAHAAGIGEEQCRAIVKGTARRSYARA